MSPLQTPALSLNCRITIECGVAVLLLVLMLLLSLQFLTCVCWELKFCFFNSGMNPQKSPTVVLCKPYRGESQEHITAFLTKSDLFAAEWVIF